MAAKKAPKVDAIVEPSKAERIQGVMDLINKRSKGTVQIKPANQYIQPYMTKRIPTGLLSLDVELRGGFPCGGISQIAGPKNSGKSYLCWQMVRQLQAMLGDKMSVLLAMTEMRADKQQAKLAGVKIAFADADIASMNRARLKSGMPEYTPDEVEFLKEQVGEIEEMHGESAEALFDGVLTAVESNAFHLIIIDSFGSIMSAAESEADSLSQKTYGGSAAVTSQFLRKLTSLLTMDDQYGTARDVCVIGINQIRDAIGDPHKEFRSPGGRALEHAKFVDLFVSSGAQRADEGVKVFTPNGIKDKFVQYGKDVNWRIEKGKAGIHEGGKGAYIYDFRTNQADFVLDTLVAGVNANVIETSGAWITIPNPSGGDPLLKICGKDAFVDALNQDAKKAAEDGQYDNSLMMYVRKKVFEHHGIDISYEWSG